VLLDYRRVLARIYDPIAYAGRLERLAGMLDRSGRPTELAVGDRRRDFISLEFVHALLSKVPEAREPFWNVFKSCRSKNPAALRLILSLMTLYTHLGPFSRFVVGEIDRRIEALDAATAPVESPVASSSAIAAGITRSPHAEAVARQS